MRVSSWVRPGSDGKLVLPPAKPHSSEEAQNRMMEIINEVGEIKGYQTFEEVDRYLMLCIWTRHDGLKTVLGSHYDDFCSWFRQRATYPDYIRRGREAMVSKGIVEVDPHVKKRMQEKAKAMQASFSK